LIKEIKYYEQRLKDAGDFVLDLFDDALLYNSAKNLFSTGFL